MIDIKDKFAKYIKNITIAINYIAGTIEGQSHIKDILQKEALKVFILGNELIDFNFNDTRKKEFKKTINLIIDIMEIAYTEELISEMNFSVFKEGINKFLNNLNSIVIADTPVSKLLQNLINTQMEIDRKNAKENAEKTYVNQEKKENKNEAAEPLNFLLKKVVDIKENNTVKTQEKTEEVEVEENVINEEDNIHKNDPIIRKKIIINLLKDKGSLNIKDIKEHIRHVTDKTILRDITELMVERKVFRVGEKRWAKYYLK